MIWRYRDIIFHKLLGFTQNGLRTSCVFGKFSALQGMHYFLTGNPFLQQEFSAIDRKAASFEMKRVPMLSEILPVISSSKTGKETVGSSTTKKLVHALWIAFAICVFLIDLYYYWQAKA